VSVGVMTPIVRARIVKRDADISVISSGVVIARDGQKKKRARSRVRERARGARVVWSVAGHLHRLGIVSTAQRP
jgi:hypothetical protein